MADDLGRISTAQKPWPDGTMVVPVWFVPQEAAAQLYQQLRIGGYSLQQAEDVRDIIE